jgi:hypothetical protein
MNKREKRKSEAQLTNEVSDLKRQRNKD